MSMLIEKRQEIVNKMNELLSERNKTIDVKVALYRAQLESEPIPEEAAKLKDVLKAIDEVIAYDEAHTVKVESQEIALPGSNATVEPSVVKEEEIPSITLETKPECVVEDVKISSTMPAGEIVDSTQGRPGMATIDIPERG